MKAPRVLLLWPGSEGAAAGNFGVPQLVGLASYLRARAGADVTVVDLACERAFGRVDLAALFAPNGTPYDVIGLACYSSFDYLAMSAVAELARATAPQAVIAAGGYHVSARPTDFVYDGSPFDVAVVGEGERPMAKVVESVAGGSPLRGVVLGPEPIDVLDDLPETDWSFLARYRPIARRVASQVEIYLSRGCPFDCAFCMERAKREVSWRGFSVDRAVAEVTALHRFLDLKGWTVYFADALFGMPKQWRRAFLERLAALDLPSVKNWLLIRVDMVDDEDLRLFGAANCAPGFGLESGDPEMLATIRKAGRLHDYLDRMLDIAESSRRLGVPWGANVIVGHPGETEASLRRSAAYMRKLFLEPKSTLGFLSVDPFRFYPGSPIDDERALYEQRFGARIHRPKWWHDGDQAFLSEWVDPSRELTYRRREALMVEEFGPILRALPARFGLEGAARPYFMRALAGQIEQFDASTRLAFADRYFAWMKYTGHGPAAEQERLTDDALGAICKEVRAPAVAAAMARTPHPSSSIATALAEVPRERFVPLDRVTASTRDEAVALDAAGASSVSAFHAYARQIELAGIGPGMRVLDLGAGTGYGTALLARIVGAGGWVRGVELDPALVARGREALASLGNVANTELVVGDALDEVPWGPPPSASGAGWDAVLCGFAVPSLPDAFTARLGHATLVVPVGTAGAQRLTRVRRGDEGLVVETLEPVLFVPLRREVPAAAAPREARPEARRRPVRLPIA